MTDVHAPRMQQEMELAAFEKGRLQGELEATRRMEAENMHQKQMLPAAGAQPIQTELIRPDVVEINRLTWAQRAAALVGEGATIAQLVLTIVWLDQYRGDVGWRDTSDGGNIQFWNTHYLTNALGLFFLANAITNYRMGPINLRPALNRLWYCFLQSCVIICFSLSLVSIIRATPEEEVWSAWEWVFCAAYAVVVLHSLYSMIVTLLEPLHHRHVEKEGAGNYGTWSSTGTHLETPEQRRDHSAYNHGARTLYAPAPVTVHHINNNARSAAGNTGGAAVPAAPVGAPRWAENPQTYAGHYWLLPRAKWAVVGFWAIGTAFLMDLVSQQQLIAAQDARWSSQVQGGEQQGAGVDRTGREMALIGATGLMILATLMCMSYVAMPPRTSIVKNGILVDPNAARRASISHNAETRLGPNNV